MEEAVTKKFVHEDSSHIIALCSKNALPLFSVSSHCLLLFLSLSCTLTLVELLSRWLGAASPSRTLLDVTVPLTMLLHQWKVNNDSQANGNQFQRQAVQNPGFLSPRHVYICVYVCLCVCKCVCVLAMTEWSPLLTRLLCLQYGVSHSLHAGHKADCDLRSAKWSVTQKLICFMGLKHTAAWKHSETGDILKRCI